MILIQKAPPRREIAALRPLRLTPSSLASPRSAQPVASPAARSEFAPIWDAHRYTQPERFLLVLGLHGYEREALELTEKLSQQPNVDPFRVFLGYYGLGRYDDALVWLRRVVDGRHLIVSTLRLPNQFPGLQEHAGYAELLSYLDSIQRSR